MNIQSYIDRKRIAGAREHEGNSTDWGLWEPEKYFVAVASELLDALAYIQRLCEIENGDTAFITDAMSYEITMILRTFPEHILEAACQEAEQEAEEPEGFMAELKRRSAEDIFKLCYPEKVNEVKQEAENG